MVTTYVHSSQHDNITRSYDANKQTNKQLQPKQLKYVFIRCSIYTCLIGNGGESVRDILWPRVARSNVHRTSWDSSHTYNLKRSLHMHKGEVGYTVKNYLGQDVLVTEPFDFGKMDGQIWRTCPKYRIRCERGYKVSPSGFGSISLPLIHGVKVLR